MHQLCVSLALSLSLSLPLSLSLSQCVHVVCVCEGLYVCVKASYSHEQFFSICGVHVALPVQVMEMSYSCEVSQ